MFQRQADDAGVEVCILEARTGCVASDPRWSDCVRPDTCVVLGRF